MGGGSGDVERAAEIRLRHLRPAIPRQAVGTLEPDNLRLPRVLVHLLGGRERATQQVERRVVLFGAGVDFGEQGSMERRVDPDSDVLEGLQIAAQRLDALRRIRLGDEPVAVKPGPDLP